MSLSPKKIKEFEAKLNAKVWKDPKFRKALLEDPKGALKEMGIMIPHNINIRIVEDDQTTVTFVIMHSPAHASEMDENELRKVANAMYVLVNVAMKPGVKRLDVFKPKR